VNGSIVSILPVAVFRIEYSTRLVTLITICGVSFALLLKMFGTQKRPVKDFS
jgi:hypothetical protein